MEQFRSFFIPLLFSSLLVCCFCNTDQKSWQSFKMKHSKSYRSLREDKNRFKIFQRRLKHIEEHNERYRNGKESYMRSINSFSDFNQHEVLKLGTVFNYKHRIPDKVFHKNSNKICAGHVDWRQKGAVSPVMVQGDCGSCYGFSTLGSLEGQYFIKYNEMIQLSVQELVDCGKFYQLKECTGGWMEDAYAYVKDNGISKWTEYPYEGKVRQCRNATISKVHLKVTGYTVVEDDEIALQQALESIGPISVAFHHKLLLDYKTGIFKHPNCPKSPLHAVLLVGYGTENGTDYWIVKNSWGTKWGENGYFRIARNWNNHCGIASWTSYPNIL